VLCALARVNLFLSLAEAPSTQRKSKAIIFKPQKPLRALRPGESLFVFVSRRGAAIAENFDVYLVVTPKTFAGFASWREFICFCLSQRRKVRKENQKL
jgi:hypothetical protein